MDYKPALTKYRPIRYAHVSICAGENYILTADPWSYIHNHLWHYGQRRRGINKKNIQRAIFFAELAQEFYKGSEAVELPSKATMIYYGMLNLVKSYLSINGVELESVIEHHGIKLPLGSNHELEVSADTSGNSISIFAKFSECLGTKVKISKKHDIQEIFKNIPEIHSVYQSVFPKEKQKFLPIAIDFLTDKNNKKLITRLKYEKKIEGLVKSTKIYTGKRKSYFNESKIIGEYVCFDSKKIRTPTNFSSLDKTYHNILNEYKNFDIASLLTPRGYYYYCDLEPDDYHHLCYTLLAMFFLGSAARYRPSMTKELLSGELRPLISETIAICPRQFLYQMSSLITKKLCVLPYANI